jgi:hypothetical protein
VGWKTACRQNCHAVGLLCGGSLGHAMTHSMWREVQAGTMPQQLQQCIDQDKCVLP